MMKQRTQITTYQVCMTISSLEVPNYILRPHGFIVIEALANSAIKTCNYLGDCSLIPTRK